MDISIIVPAYNEVKNLPELYKQIKSALKRWKGKYEVIVVDDGSIDRTWEEIGNQQSVIGNHRGIRLRKNQGKSAALSVGFKEAKGDVLVTIDADLQDDPKDILTLIYQIDQGYDVVSGWRQDRSDNGFKKMSTWLFNILVTKTTGVKLHDFNCGLKAYRKEVIESTNLSGGMHRFMPVLAAWQGFRVTEVPVKNHPRKYGRSKYGFERALKGFLDLVTIIFLNKYAQRPLRLFGTIGVILSGLGFLVGIYLTYLRVIGEKIGDRPLLILAVLLMVLGVQFFSLGLIGEMLANQKSKSSPIENKI